MRWRWFLIVILALSVFVTEVDEHLGGDFRKLLDARHYLEFHFLREIILHGSVFPLIIGIILGVLGRARSEQRQAIHHLDRQHELNQQLINVLKWDELTALLVRFPRTVVPLAGAFLLVSDQTRRRFELAAEWWDPEIKISPTSIPFLTSDFGRICVLAQSSSLCQLMACNRADNPCIPQESNHFCLPLLHRKQLIALLHLYLPPGEKMTAHQIEILNGLAPSMAVAIHSAQPQHAVKMRGAIVKTERRRLARRLHDSLGQSLGYLHLKLDQLSTNEDLRDMPWLRLELAQLREAANEAYEQIREMLAASRPSNSTDLALVLLTQARMVGKDAGFEVRLGSGGRSGVLSPIVQEKVLHICQEALNNVAKHARASVVHINLSWEEDILTIKLADNGRGFDPDNLPSNRHFGLAIMRERAAEINGYLEIASGPNSGTELTLCLPMDRTPQLIAEVVL